MDTVGGHKLQVRGTKLKYYITYKNQGTSERTPTMFERKASSKKNVELLKIQGATSIRIHWVKE